MNRFEDLAQQLIEASLARAMGGKLSGNEVLRAIVRAIDDAQADGGTTPNHFWVTLNDNDLRELERTQPRIAEEMSESVRQIMLQMGLRLDAPPRVLLWGSPNVPAHRLSVKARHISNSLPQQDTAATPAVANTRRYSRASLGMVRHSSGRALGASARANANTHSIASSTDSAAHRKVSEYPA